MSKKKAVKKKEPLAEASEKHKEQSQLPVRKLIASYSLTPEQHEKVHNLAIKKDTVIFQDLRFGTLSQLTNRKVKSPIMGFQLVHKENKVTQVEMSRGKDLFKFIDFKAYWNKIF